MRVPADAVPRADRAQFAAVAGQAQRRTSASAGRDCSVTWATPPIEARASPRKPRVHVKEIVGRVELAGGVAGEGQRQIVASDAAAVVDDADQLDAALLDVDVDARAAGIDGVFEQFLDDAGRPFDDLAGGDLGDDGIGKLLNSRHQSLRC